MKKLPRTQVMALMSCPYPQPQLLPDIPPSSARGECRMAFIERRKLDPSKNLPYVKIPIS